MNQAEEIRRKLLPVVHGPFFKVREKTLPGRMYAEYYIEAMRKRPPALEPWKNRKHVRIRQKANDMVASGELKPKACQHRGCSVGPSKTVKHHVDYDRPDNVKWYCEPHHDDTHAAMDKMPVESCGDLTTDQLSNQSQQIMADLDEGFIGDALIRRTMKKNGFRENSPMKFFNQDGSMVLLVREESIDLGDSNQIVFASVERKIGSLSRLMKMLENTRPGKLGFIKSDYQNIAREIRIKSKVIGGHGMQPIFALGA